LTRQIVKQQLGQIGVGNTNSHESQMRQAKAMGTGRRLASQPGGRALISGVACALERAQRSTSSFDLVAGRQRLAQFEVPAERMRDSCERPADSISCSACRRSDSRARFGHLLRLAGLLLGTLQLPAGTPDRHGSRSRWSEDHRRDQRPPGASLLSDSSI
jgi:hypothetical protein